jgi:3-phenylpropionate/cinnamic acid dioxygenase small subunit
MDALDLLGVHQLLAEYGHTIDARDWTRFSELFDPDATLDYTAVRAPSMYRGMDEILTYFRDANHPAAHHVTNIVVHEQEDGVHVYSKFLAPFTQASHVPHRWYGGDYHDVVIRGQNGSWRFRSKVCIPRWQFTAEPFDQSNLEERRRSF